MKIDTFLKLSVSVGLFLIGGAIFYFLVISFPERERYRLESQEKYESERNKIDADRLMAERNSEQQREKEVCARLASEMFRREREVRDLSTSPSMGNAILYQFSFDVHYKTVGNYCHMNLHQRVQFHENGSTRTSVDQYYLFDVYDNKQVGSYEGTGHCNVYLRNCHSLDEYLEFSAESMIE